MARVLIIGASPSPERYSYKALKMLEDHGHEVLLYSPNYDVIEGHDVIQDLSSLKSHVDVITVYVNPKISTTMKEEILSLSPRVTIFNPGTENEGLASQLKLKGLQSIEACTLVLLTTNQFDDVIS